MLDTTYPTNNSSNIDNNNQRDLGNLRLIGKGLFARRNSEYPADGMRSRPVKNIPDDIRRREISPPVNPDPKMLRSLPIANTLKVIEKPHRIKILIRLKHNCQTEGQWIAFLSF